jgi:hypothetical protein
MEGDPSLIANGETFWADPSVKDRPKLSRTRTGIAVRTVGDLFRFTQKIIAEGFDHNPRPSTADIDRNPVLGTLGQIGARKNAQDFGLHGLSPQEEMGRDSSLVHHWHHHRWDANGRNIYELTEGVVQAFIETDVTVVPEALDLPESTAFIAVPESLGMKVWHAQTGHHPLGGFYVTVSKEFVYIVACGYAHPGKPSYDNALASFTIPLVGETIQAWIEAEQENAVSVKIMGSNAESVPKWSNLVINAILYIANVKDDVTLNPLYGVPPQKLAHANKIQGKRVRQKYLDSWRANCRYHVLGQAAQRVLSQRKQESVGTPQQVRYLVRGHWRQQPYGPKHSLRKLLWIQPFWKGDEDAPVVSTTHVHLVE